MGVTIMENLFFLSLYYIGGVYFFGPREDASTNRYDLLPSKKEDKTYAKQSYL